MKWRIQLGIKLFLLQKYLQNKNGYRQQIIPQGGINQSNPLRINGFSVTGKKVGKRYSKFMRTKSMRIWKHMTCLEKWLKVKLNGRMLWEMVWTSTLKSVIAPNECHFRKSDCIP